MVQWAEGHIKWKQLFHASSDLILLQWEGLLWKWAMMACHWRLAPFYHLSQSSMRRGSVVRDASSHLMWQAVPQSQPPESPADWYISNIQTAQSRKQFEQITKINSKMKPVLLFLFFFVMRLFNRQRPIREHFTCQSRCLNHISLTWVQAHTQHTHMSLIHPQAGDWLSDSISIPVQAW